MQQTIQKITQQLIDRLPENDQYYRLNELRSWEFPPFIIRRIKIELERNLAESMIIPKTDWANTNSDAVLDAWQQFVDAIRAEARLPASYAQTVIETAVADVVEILVQPRKNIPEVIFGSADQLDYDRLAIRVKAIVVYPQFATLILKYMQRKKLDSLSKKRCAHVVTKADEKLTRQYSPLNWAQMLGPLFNLVGGELDTNLLRLFFEDKDKPHIARKFDRMNDSLTRAELIEILSSPDLLNFEGYEEEQSNLFKNQPADDKSISQPKQDIVEDKEGSLNQKPNFTEEQQQNEEHEIPPPDIGQESAPKNEPENTLNTGFMDQNEMEAEPEEPSEDEDSLNAGFSEMTDEEVRSPFEDDSTPEEEKKVEPDDRAQPEVKSQDRNPEEEQGSKAEPEQKNPVTEPNKEKPSSKETPMWMRYMSEEEIEEYKEKKEQAEDEGFIDDPIIDLSEEKALEKKVQKLRKQLSDDQDIFIEEIFRGSERAYDEALEDIASYDNWSDLSKYVERDVFKRNLVDMYSEAAVDFTDRLQGYFLEKQNRNK